MRLLMLAALAALFSLFACVRTSKVVGVACSATSDCVLDGVSGTCEASGFCSYPDVTCAGGQRYSPGAGDGLGNTCLGGDLPCGGQDAVCCPGNVCGDHLTCDTTSLTCVCGGEGDLCCGGTTCAANLACNAAGTCACGGIGEPCCGGDTCDTGTTCTAGTCEAGVTQIVLGAGHACALRTNGSVWCWGQDWQPYPSNRPQALVNYIGSTEPLEVQGLGDVAQLASAEFSVCARKVDGTVACWGHNESGQLGDGTLLGRRAPATIAGLTNVTMLDGGRLHMCAVGAYNGTQGVWCWGRNGRGNRESPDDGFGRLGNNDLFDSSVPVAVDLADATSAGQTVRALATGNYHSCVALSDNTVWCWGRNDYGQLGSGTNEPTRVPVQVVLDAVTIPTGATIDEVTCSDGTNYYGASTCMRLSTGAVYCWGHGEAGQLGDGAQVGRLAPTVAVDTTALAGDPIVEIASAMQVMCGRTQGGNVWCWGYNRNGIVGNDDDGQDDYPTPERVLVANAAQLEMSHRTACAVDTAQRLFCWGSNVRNPMLAQVRRAYAPIEVKP